jgi:DNA repair protein RadC
MSDDKIIESALAILARRMSHGDVLADPQAVRNYLSLKLADKEYEVFGLLYLDSQNRVIGHAELFRGTLNQTAVYPREVVKAALQANAAGVLLFHNHPSGVQEPSMADRALTSALKTALALVDVTVLDHFIAAGPHCYSFAEKGLM